MNQDSSDNMAYAVVAQVSFKVEKDGQVYHINDTDRISGSDWDNNGKIDILEGHPTLHHTVSVVEYR